MDREDLVEVARGPKRNPEFKRDLRELSTKEAREVVNVVLDSISEALRRGETVDLPFGTFEVVERAREPLRGWFLDRIRVTYKQQKYIRFTFGEV